jgi:hypothetical protein
MESAAKRLNRWSNDPVLNAAGKPRTAQIVPTDLQTLLLFNRYGFLNTSFISAFRKSNEQALQSRLNLLYRKPNSYLDRPLAARQSPNENYKDQQYAIAEKGVTVARRSGLWRDDVQPFGNARHFPHSVMINETIASLELYAPSMLWREAIPRASNRLTVSINYVSPNGVHSTKTHDYENDSHGPFGVRLEDGRVRFLSLEAEHESVADRETLEQSSFVRKFLSIRHIAQKKLYESEWGIPHLLSLVVCPTQHEIDQRKEIIMRETANKGCSYILFQVVPSLARETRSNKPMRHLYDGPWQRAGHSDFRLNQP